LLDRSKRPSPTKDTCGAHSYQVLQQEKLDHILFPGSTAQIIVTKGGDAGMLHLKDQVITAAGRHYLFKEGFTIMLMPIGLCDSLGYEDVVTGVSLAASYGKFGWR
jgi:hypothetical protein